MKTPKIKIFQKAHLPKTSIDLPASKSMANRALIIDALANGNSKIDNLSEARDTQTMRRLLNSNDYVLDVLDAGTTMRFLTAFLSVNGRDCELTGTKRMQERPISVLVDALRKLGMDIKYKSKEGFPPLLINGFEKQMTQKLQIRGDISSQYISALLMIGPVLPMGLTLELTGRIGSVPYIGMTLEVMKDFGVEASWKDNIIDITPQNYNSTSYTIEPDWSAASYWYSLVALAEDASITLNGLSKNSIQGDSAIADIMLDLGVKTEFTEEGAKLSKTNHQSFTSIDFINCPDLAQTVMAICAVKGIECKMSGLESLRIKETDRIAAFQIELGKINAKIIEEKGEWLLIPDKQFTFNGTIEFSTYEDHRMAMALAPIATRTDVVINEPDVVLKSYPRYWEDYSKAAFRLEEM